MSERNGESSGSDKHAGVSNGEALRMQRRLLSTTDAQAWAQEFIKVWGGHRIGSPNVDEALMIAWFAAAIETGRSAGKSASLSAERKPVYCNTAAGHGFPAGGDRCAHCGKTPDEVGLTITVSHERQRDAGWWCHQCLTVIHESDVTYQEHHDVRAGGCGGKVSWVPLTGTESSSATRTSVGPLKLDTEQQVFFYEQDHYYLSNFSAFRLRWKGFDFDTSEAAYQWEKFNLSPPEHRGAILAATSAHEAFKYAELHGSARRRDWDDVKVEIMFSILRAKADQHEYVRRKLLETGRRELIENSWRDPFWGWGPNRDGKNMLGKLWMQVRAELRRDDGEAKR